MNRGHGLAEFINAVLLIAPYHFPVCVHMILNLPGDTMEDARESARVLSALPVSMVKLHSLYIPKECALYKEYEAGNIQTVSYTHLDVYKRQVLVNEYKGEQR